VNLIVGTKGCVRCIYDEAIDLTALGSLSIKRASYVEPDESGRWWADLAPMNGPRLGPFVIRSEALDAEQLWLEEYLARQNR
jgi:hypothetical protein